MRRMLLVALATALTYYAGCSSKPPTETAAKPAAAVEKQADAGATTFPDEPAAHALYNQMIEAMRNAESLSFVSQYHFGVEGEEEQPTKCTYRAWLKKPNYFRVEAELSGIPEKGGTLIGDGDDMWIFWPQGCPRYVLPFEETKDHPEARLGLYMTEPAPVGGHSIGHAVDMLGPLLCMTVVDLSTFHGCTDGLQGLLDGVKAVGSEEIDGEGCDQMEVSYMKHQRSWNLWLSQRDHLPRKLKEITRVNCNIITDERWSSVVVNGEIPESMFAWKPPEGWKEWRRPDDEDWLLKPGVAAPEFDLVAVDGKRIRPSDYRGRVIWFYLWRAG